MVVLFLPLQNDLGPAVKVVLISVMNSGVANIGKVEFQVAVPKSMRVKLQPPTGRDLPAFNPLAAAPTIIKQVMLIASPSQVREGGGGGTCRMGHSGRERERGSLGRQMFLWFCNTTGMAGA